MLYSKNFVNQIVALTSVLFLLVSGIEVTKAAKPSAPLTIKSAVYNKKAAKLTVKTVVKNTTGLLTLLHGKGGVLGQTRDNKHTFSIPLAQLGDIPCQVEVRLGDLKVNRTVKGASADCKKVPICTVLSPVENASAAYNQNTPFEAQVILKDKKAGPIHYEWDFAGGVMGHPSGQLPGTGNVKADATFVRNNSRYRVRFTATDALGRRCESSVNVVVGTLPAGLPNIEPLAEAAQQSAPSKANALQKAAGERVVLPYQDWTMQTASDARTVPDVYVVYGPQVNNINATVYEKARKPVVLGSDKIELKYSATSNPADPIGANSINSTSQNWPVGTPLMQATLQKSDYFQTPGDPATSFTHTSYSFAGFLTPELASAADEGYHSATLSPPLNPDHGRYMPGIAAPYAANDPQPFSEYVPDDNRFAALMLPLTDIDDSGRVNPTPLFRVKARDIGNNTPVSATDIVVNSGRDLHCRECHAKGKIGANPNRGYTPTGHSHGGLHEPPSFFESDSDSLFDQEYAAIRNIANLHQYGKAGHGGGVWAQMEHSGMNQDENGKPITFSGGPKGCNDDGCHTSAILKTPYKRLLYSESSRSGQPLSTNMHIFHGQLQYNATKDDILRITEGNNKGLPALAPLGSTENWDPVVGIMPNSLFPVKDANGKILPMEENCLKCHGGKREQCYRDRMYTAGVTCYQCHGDMLAVGNGFKKSTPGPDGSILRLPWIDEPECGACHTGNGNQGKTGSGDFFSAGVMRTAFDESDRSATPRQPDLFNPDASRFAVPVTAMDIGVTDNFGLLMTTKTRLFRVGKDNHGQVACAACHGAAHTIWPNRDPNANDNVTALQLQGHLGHIQECSVCHTADAFAKFEDIDQGVKSVDAKIGVLGGPHNMHPVNDPNWWKQAAGDTVDSTPKQPKRNGVIKGGWHNDYAKIPGRAGEDQCAACHGNDHKGTRLSKTLVDREFVNEKGKKVKVKAGTSIGCDLCHTVAKSCTGSPNQTDCGQPSERIANSTNLPPVISSQPVTQAIVGEDYRYEVIASDPEGSELKYQLAGSPNAKYPLFPSINEKTGIVTVPSSRILEYLANRANKFIPPTNMSEFQILVSDSQGARTAQAVTATLDCPNGQIWDDNSLICAKVTFTSQLSIAGLNAGQPFNYKVVAKQRSGEPLSYGLTGQPAGMTIDAKTGLIIWNTPSDLLSTNQFNFVVTAVNAQGDTATQQIAFTVCGAPLHWDETAQTCQGPVNFSSYPTITGISAGEIYTYQATAIQVNSLPLTYSLTNPPEGMAIDSNTGLISWLVQAAASGPVSFTVNASDTVDSAQQEINLMVCAAPEIWDGVSACSTPITFTSEPSYGVDVGQTYQYQVTVIHAQGLPLTYSLGDLPGEGQPPKPAGISIDAQTGLISWMAQTLPAEAGGYASFSVTVTDSNGYSISQNVQVLVCESPTNWDATLQTCRGPVRITSKPIGGLNNYPEGQKFTYQMTATNSAGLPLTYSLTDAPENMTINASTGLIEWDVPVSQNLAVQFTVIASDALGQQEQQAITLWTCPYPSHYEEKDGNIGCF